MQARDETTAAPALAPPTSSEPAPTTLATPVAVAQVADDEPPAAPPAQAPAPPAPMPATEVAVAQVADGEPPAAPPAPAPAPMPATELAVTQVADDEPAPAPPAPAPAPVPATEVQVADDVPLTMTVPMPVSQVPSVIDGDDGDNDKNIDNDKAAFDDDAALAAVPEAMEVQAQVTVDRADNKAADQVTYTPLAPFGVKRPDNAAASEPEHHEAFPLLLLGCING